MTSGRPYLCTKHWIGDPCLCTKKILWELNSFHMLKLSFFLKQFAKLPTTWLKTMYKVGRPAWIVRSNWNHHLQRSITINRSQFLGLAPSKVNTIQDSRLLVSGTWIPDSNLKQYFGFFGLNPNSKGLDSGLHEQKFPWFRTDPDCLIWDNKTLNPRSNLTVRTMVRTCWHSDHTHKPAQEKNVFKSECSTKLR